MPGGVVPGADGDAVLARIAAAAGAEEEVVTSCAEALEAAPRGLVRLGEGGDRGPRHDHDRRRREEDDPASTGGHSSCAHICRWSTASRASSVGGATSAAPPAARPSIAHWTSSKRRRTVTARPRSIRAPAIVLGGEPRDRVAGGRAGVGVHDLVQRGLPARLEPPRELVEDVAELVEPVPLRAGLPHAIGVTRPLPPG